MRKAHMHSPPSTDDAVESRLNSPSTKLRPRPELVQFRNTMLQAMERKGITPSALARLMFGTMTNKRGLTVARNRDRIAQYLAGTSYPEAQNLIRMAKILGVEVQALSLQRPGARMPRRILANGQDDKTDVVISLLTDPPGMAILEVRPRRMSQATVMKIVELLNAEPRVPEPDETVDA